jgi:hypothetical protein
MIVLLAHFFGCGFHYVSYYGVENGEENTWLNYKELEHADILTKYIESFYFAFVTASTVGYGDVFKIIKFKKKKIIFI